MKLSIITPVYNRASTVGRTIESVINQSYRNFELILVNDGSSDDSDSVIQPYLTDKRIVYINYSPNRGVNHARNRGIEKATGEFILFLDSDDYLTNDALETIVERIKKDDNYNHYLFLIDYRRNDTALPDKEKVINFEDWLKGKLSGDFMHVLKPTCFKDHMFFEEFRAAEFLNWLRIYRDFGDMLLIPEVVLNVDLTSEDSLSRGLTLSSYKAIRDKYQFTSKALELYSLDYQLIIPRQYPKLLMENFLLGVCCLKIRENKRILQLLKSLNLKYSVLHMVNNHFVGLAIRTVVILKGKVKLLRWK